MPRVSEEHLERRRQQILDAAQTCFARKGLHTTTMQDVFAESGLSAGAVYRYFKSKDDIIAALTTEATVELRAVMYESVYSDPLPTPPQLIRTMADSIVRLSGPGGPVRLIPQAWSMALTDPNIGDYVRTNMGGIRRLWFDYTKRMQELGWLRADADTDAVAKALLGLMPGFILQHLIMGDTDPETFARGVEQLLPSFQYSAPSH
ncbi:TetR/AcrR family transcriptional regulator [Nocardia huaxiensis]|uniref:TetR/AcrR family transcriptional regulator n=1 Tax=Nocardia huaxiensis TaxID=2755382 RepID=A0A7D6VHZ6_9NOCA|nr:TetR/AcrR family transcriptional regulator [Nocardia huaxiensis]QLY33255.1 TetR/AcrR family transcriptional regulator [Nocardia huaxiensis]UFS99813.1 TetR/AcrR family transcriptional regulator [Nocardia huaxiensis]